MSPTVNRETRREKLSRLAVRAAVIASLVIPLAARAGDEYGDRPPLPPSYAQMMKMKPLDVMHMMDVEHNGRVTKEQFMKFHESMFDRMDKNKDGVLTREEFMHTPG